MSKIDQLFDQLQNGWCSVESLATTHGWQNHTLRAAISVNARKRSLTIERKRENGVAFYRVKPRSEPEEIRAEASA